MFRINITDILNIKQSQKSIGKFYGVNIGKFMNCFLSIDRRHGACENNIYIKQFSMGNNEVLDSML